MDHTDDPHFSEPLPGLTIHHSRIYNTNTGILSAEDGIILIDPSFLPQDLDRIADKTGNKTILAGLSTHGHYDHVFWSRRFGSTTPRYASEATVALRERFEDEAFKALDELEREYFGNKPQWQREGMFDLIPLKSGTHTIAGINVELINLPGHMQGQVAFYFWEIGALFAGDTLSDIEIPTIDNTPTAIEDYLDSLNRIKPWISRSKLIVPGHGTPAGHEEAARRLNLDQAYLCNLQSVRSSLNTVEKASVSSPEPATAKKSTSKRSEQILQIARQTTTDPRLSNPDCAGMHRANIQILLNAD